MTSFRVRGKTRVSSHSSQRLSAAEFGIWRAIDGDLLGNRVPLTFLTLDSRSMRSWMGPGGVKVASIRLSSWLLTVGRASSEVFV